MTRAKLENDKWVHDKDVSKDDIKAFFNGGRREVKNDDKSRGEAKGDSGDGGSGEGGRKKAKDKTKDDETEEENQIITAAIVAASVVNSSDDFGD